MYQSNYISVKYLTTVAQQNLVIIALCAFSVFEDTSSICRARRVA